MKQALKKWGPTLAPVVLALVTFALPQVQSWIGQVLAPFFQHLLLAHPGMATALFAALCAVYHAIPSPYRK